MRTKSASIFFAILTSVSAQAQGGGSTGNIPINDLGAGTYMGFQGGLYPGGQNAPPAGHAAAAQLMAGQIVSRDASGNPSPDGKVLMLSIGMSNTTHEFSVFERQEDLNAGRNARVVII